MALIIKRKEGQFPRNQMVSVYQRLKRETMPAVECPVVGCDYKTPDLDTSIVTVLIEAHCKNHEKSAPTTNDQPPTTNDRPPTTNGHPPTTNDQPRPSSSCGKYYITIQLKCLNANIGSLILCIIAFLLDIGFSFSPQYWFKREDQTSFLNTTTTVGLWKGCVVAKGSDGQLETQCWDHDDKNFPFDYMFVGAAQVFQCLGVIFIAVAAIAIIVKLASSREAKVLTYIAGCHALWAAVCFAGSAGVVHPGLKRISSPGKDFTKDISLSYGFAFLSALVALLGGLLLLSNELNTYMNITHT